MKYKLNKKGKRLTKQYGNETNEKKLGKLRHNWVEKLMNKGKL